MPDHDSSSLDQSGSRYHHGDLPDALRAAAIDVIVDVGLGGFSLREVARRAGVSHAAPGYHFGDVRGLLTWVAVEGFEVLHHDLAAAAASVDDPTERLKAIGRAYVGVAIDHPAHCEVIFRDDVIDADDPRVQHAGLVAYGVLEAAVADLAARHNADLDVPTAARLCWSAMQGLVTLHAKFTHLDTTFGHTPTRIEAQADSFTDLLLSGLIPASTRRRPRASTR